MYVYLCSVYLQPYSHSTSNPDSNLDSNPDSNLGQPQHKLTI